MLPLFLRKAKIVLPKKRKISIRALVFGSSQTPIVLIRPSSFVTPRQGATKVRGLAKYT